MSTQRNAFTGAFDHLTYKLPKGCEFDSHALTAAGTFRNVHEHHEVGLDSLCFLGKQTIARQKVTTSLRRRSLAATLREA
jgi:hypothetical protein